MGKTPLAKQRSVVNVIRARREDRNPVIVIPVAYGRNADIRTLNSIARNSATRVQSGEQKNIQKVFSRLKFLRNFSLEGIIGSYF